MATRDLIKMPNALKPGISGTEEPATDQAQAVEMGPENRARREMIHRLQVGLSGLGAMILLVGLANIIQDRARLVDEQAAPEAAPTVEPVAAPTQSDPLADAGVVPDLPAEPSPIPQEPAILPEQGEVSDTR